MKTPESLETLVDYGIIQEVIRPLMSGKEAHVYVVVSGGEECVAKVYKEATERTFKHRIEYTEGRRTRNTRDQRAINKRTRHGRRQDEAAWRNAEVDTLYRLRSGGVRVPEPINYVDGVLVMELVKGADGHPAPRLGDVEFEAAEANDVYQKLIREVVRMLCAGVIHGDLSEFNVLMGADGPVVIDFPQSVDPSKNQNARKLLLRDVENLHRFQARHCPKQKLRPYAEEMWALYEKNQLAPDTQLAGNYIAPSGDTNMDEVLALIEDANQDEQMRREARGDDTPIPHSAQTRRVVDFTTESKPRGSGGRPRWNTREADSGRPREAEAKKVAESRAPSAERGKTPAKRRSRRRRLRGTEPDRQASVHTEGGDPVKVPTRPSPQGDEKTRPEERDRARKRRRRRQPTRRAKNSGENVATKPEARRPAAPAEKPAGTRPSTSNKSEAAPPRRRRRRRPRTPGSRTT